MKKLFFLAAVAMSCSLLAAAQSPAAANSADSATATPCANPTYPGAEWKQDSAAASGWSQTKLAAAQQYADSIHDSSVVVIQCGRLVDEWGEVSRKLTTFSARKSFISALYGIYSAEGKIDINQTLEQAGIDDSPSPLTKQERQARIVDLLRARSGVYHAAGFETDAMKRERPARGSHAPGTFWVYNNWDFNTLGTIFEKKTGMKIGDAFYERIAKPIGMQDFKPGDVYYVGDSKVSEHNAYMFAMSSRDMARFGLLYLDHGRWEGKQIIPAAWVDVSTHATEMIHAGNYDLGGYEYLWWVEYGGVHLPEVTLPGMYSARGAGGHFILVIPTLNIVIVSQYSNEPTAHDPRSVVDAAQDKHAVFDPQFGHLVKLIMDARSSN